jgi:hypothetical protein
VQDGEPLEYDGWDGTKFLEAKARYAQFVDQNGQWEPWFRNSETGLRQLVREAENQVRYARGRPIEWHAMQPEVADALRDTFANRGITGITVKHTPLAPEP